MLLQVSPAVEACAAEVAGERPLTRVDDDVSCKLRAALLVFAADVADKVLRQTRSVGVDDLSMSLKVAETSEAATAEVAGVRSDLAVDHRVARQQRPEFENLAADGTRERLRRRLVPPASGGLVSSDLQVNTEVVLLQAGGAQEAAQTDAAAVRLVPRVDARMSGKKRLRLQTPTADATGKPCVGRRVLLAAGLVAVHQDLVAFQLVLAAKLATADVAQVRPLTGVRLEVDGKLRPELKLFAAEVAQKGAGALRRLAAVHVDDLLVMLEVVGPHVSFGAQVAAERFDAQVNDLVCLQRRPAPECFPTHLAQPRLQLALLLQLGDAIRVQPVQVVLQVVAAVEAQLAQVTTVRLLPRVDEGVTSQTRLVPHHFTAHVTHGAVRLQLHTERCMLGILLAVLQGRGRRVRHIWGDKQMTNTLLKR